MSFYKAQRVDGYCTMIEREGEKVYSAWKRSGVSSKKIVQKANEYAFNKKLKKSFTLRIKVLVFAYALEKRLQNRYDTFLKKLFRFLSYWRERATLRLLKRVLGFSSTVQLKEAIKVEMERLAEKLSERLDKEDVDGGRISSVGLETVEEELKVFLQETEKEMQTESLEHSECGLGEEGLDFTTDNVDFETNEAGKENTPVKEQKETLTTKDAKDGVKAEETSKEEAQKGEKQQEKKAQEKPQEKTNERKTEQTQKSVANTSILAEAMVMGKVGEQETRTPFPIFKAGENPYEADSLDATGGEKAVDVQAKGENGTMLDKGSNQAVTETRTPFPVFRGGGGGERPVEAIREERQPATEDNSKREEGSTRGQEEVSEENIARREVNNTLTEEQVQSIFDQMQVKAQNDMQNAEASWREKISVTEGAIDGVQRGKPVEVGHDNGAVAQNLKH